MEERELTRLVEKFSGTVYRAAYCCLRNSADADDIMQDTFLALYTTDTEFSSDEHIKAWLIRVAVNRCRNLLRSVRYRMTVSLEEAGEIPAGSGKRGSLLPEVMRLKPKYRVALYMFYYEDMSISDIAKATNQKETTVKSQLKRGRDMLKKALKGGNGYEF